LEIWTILRDVVVLLAAALLCGGLVSRLGHSPLVGYLLAGMLLGGPGSLSVIQTQHEIEAVAELGVALLLFSLGLEFSAQRLRELGNKPLWGGVLQVSLTLLVGTLVVWPLGIPLRAAIAFGAMISLSSTAVVLRMLVERSELERPHGRNCLAVLLTQDMAVVPLALMMTILGGEGGFWRMMLTTGWLVVATTGLVLALLLLNQIARLCLGTLTLQRHRELTVIFAVGTGLGSAWAAHAAGISPALGAFVAGMLLGSSPFATQIRADVSSLRVLLLTLFFSSAGMVADPRWMLSNWALVLIATAMVTLGKLLVIWAIFRWLGQSTRVAAATGFCLAQVGEFAFVLGTMGKSSGVVSDDLYALVISTVIASFLVSAFMVPSAVWFGDWMAKWFDPHIRDLQGEPSLERIPDVVLIGFGPAGQASAEALLDRDLRVVVIDLNQEGVKLANRCGFHGEIGDATQLDVLEHALVPQCKAVFITISHYQSAITILDNVRQLAPHAFVLVRSRYKLYTDEFASRGVTVVGDEEAVGRELAENITSWVELLPKESKPRVPELSSDP
jgi:CPA2 family monovalent cation:H+ antiporter-2